jgi:hypothetical protein
VKAYIYRDTETSNEVSTIYKFSKRPHEIIAKSVVAYKPEMKTLGIDLTESQRACYAKFLLYMCTMHPCIRYLTALMIIKPDINAEITQQIKTWNRYGVLQTLKYRIQDRELLETFNLELQGIQTSSLDDDTVSVCFTGQLPQGKFV